MSDNLYDILNRLNQLNEGLNPQQRSVPQLPADAKPKHISVLGSKTDPEHPFAGYMVGTSESVVDEEQKPFMYKVVCDQYDKGNFVDKEDAIASAQKMIYGGEKEYTTIEVKELKDGDVIWRWHGKKDLDEVSLEKLGQYKKAAGAAATAADKAGDFEKGHKRFKGIVKATNKEFEKSAKKDVAEGSNDPYGSGYDRGAAAGTMNAPDSKHPEGSKEHKDYMAGYKKGVSSYNNKTKQYKKQSREQGVAEGESQLYKHHQELRKKSGLPDPEVYKKMMKQKQAEIDALNAEISADKKDVKEADLSVPDVTGPAPQEGDWVKGKIGIGPYAGKLGQIERIDPKRNVMRMGPEALVWMKTAAREEWLPLKWLVKVGGSKFAESKINEEVANEDVLSALKTKLGDLLLQTLGKEIKDTDLKSKKDNKDDKEVNPIIKKITTDDGHEICIHGNEDDGFRVSVKQKEAPTVYKTLDEAVMACEMYCAHRKNKKLNADYVDES